MPSGSPTRCSPPPSPSDGTSVVDPSGEGDRPVTYPSGVPSAHQVRLLALSVAIVTVSTLPVFLTGAAFFQIGPELGVGPLGLGVVTAAFFLTASAASPFLGRWVQRVGWQRAMRVNVVASALVVASVAVLARSPWSLGGMLVAAAVMYGSSNPAANLALARHTPPERTGIVFGLKHAGIPSSTLLAGLAVPALVLRHGWRTSFVAAGVLAAAVWFLIPSGADPPGPAVRRSQASPPELPRGVLRRLGVAAALGAVAAVALGTYMVSAALDAGLSEATAGWLQFGGSASSITARIASGILADRTGRVYLPLGVLLGIGAVVFAVLPWTAGLWFGLGVLAAYASGWGWPGLMTAAVVGANRSSAASSSAVTQAGVFVGAGGGPLVLGLVVDAASYGPMWLVVAGCLAGAAAVVWSVRRPAPSAPL